MALNNRTKGILKNHTTQHAERLAHETRSLTFIEGTGGSSRVGAVLSKRVHVFPSTSHAVTVGPAATTTWESGRKSAWETRCTGYYWMWCARKRSDV